MEKVKDSVTARKSKTSKKRAPKLNKRVSNPVEENANKNGTDSAAQPRHILADSSLPDKSSVGESKPKVKHRVIFDKEAPPPPPPPCLPFDSAGTLIVPFLKSTPEKRNAAMFSDIWLSISNIFCFTSSNYVSDDDYILYTGSMDDDNDVPTVRGAKDPSRRKNSMKKKSKSFILESMKVFDWSEDTPVPEQNPKNLLFFSRSGDYSNDKDLLGLDLNEEGQRILSIFTGVTRVSGVVLNWNLKASKKDVNIHTCDIHNSPWQAIKSDCIIQQDKKKILDLLLDDTRSCEYDEAMEGYEVSFL